MWQSCNPKFGVAGVVRSFSSSAYWRQERAKVRRGHFGFLERSAAMKVDFAVPSPSDAAGDYHQAIDIDARVPAAPASSPAAHGAAAHGASSQALPMAPASAPKPLRRVNTFQGVNEEEQRNIISLRYRADRWVAEGLADNQRTN